MALVFAGVDAAGLGFCGFTAAGIGFFAGLEAVAPAPDGAFLAAVDEATLFAVFCGFTAAGTGFFFAAAGAAGFAAAVPPTAGAGFLAAADA